MFADAEGKMNHSVVAAQGQILLVSQFTLCADVRKGTRPSFSSAMAPAEARNGCARVASALALEVLVQQGRFGAMMDVSLNNDGPVTIWLDSRLRNE